MAIYKVRVVQQVQIHAIEDHPPNTTRKLVETVALALKEFLHHCQLRMSIRLIASSLCGQGLRTNIFVSRSLRICLLR